MIGNQVRRTSRSPLLTSLLFLAGLGFTLVLSWNYLTYVLGTHPTLTPEQVTTQELAQLSGRLVTVSGNESFPSGLQWVKGDHVAHDYLILDTGSAWLLVKAQPSDAGRKQFTGTIEDVPPAVHDQVLAEIRKQDSGAPDRLLGHVLNANDYQREGRFGIGIGAILLAFALWNWYRWQRRASGITAPSRSPHGR